MHQGIDLLGKTWLPRAKWFPRLLRKGICNLLKKVFIEKKVDKWRRKVSKAKMNKCRFFLCKDITFMVVKCNHPKAECVFFHTKNQESFLHENR